MLREEILAEVVSASEAMEVSPGEEYAWGFIRSVSAALKRGERLPALGEGIPMEEIRRTMMRVYPVVGAEALLLRRIAEMDSLLPVAATMDRPLLREVLYAVLLRPAIGEGKHVSWIDYDTVTLAWRCKMGPLHPEDDNDVCSDAFVEWMARALQRERPGLSRETARIEAFLMK